MSAIIASSSASSVLSSASSTPPSLPLRFFPVQRGSTGSSTVAAAHPRARRSAKASRAESDAKDRKHDGGAEEDERGKAGGEEREDEEEETEKGGKKEGEEKEEEDEEEGDRRGCAARVLLPSFRPSLSPASVPLHLLSKFPYITFWKMSLSDEPTSSVTSACDGVQGGVCAGAAGCVWTTVKGTKRRLRAAKASSSGSDSELRWNTDASRR
jgi:hypothetical protein